MTYSTVPLTAGTLDQRVADLMHEHPVTIPASMPLAAAARQMARRRRRRDQRGPGDHP